MLLLSHLRHELCARRLAHAHGASWPGPSGGWLGPELPAASVAASPPALTAPLDVCVCGAGGSGSSSGGGGGGEVPVLAPVPGMPAGMFAGHCRRRYWRTPGLL